MNQVSLSFFGAKMSWNTWRFCIARLTWKFVGLHTLFPYLLQSSRHLLVKKLCHGILNYFGHLQELSLNWRKTENTTLPSRPDTHECFCCLKGDVFLMMPRVCFKLITWCIQMHHVRTFFLCGVMTFSYYVMFIHNEFVFKRKGNNYRAFSV